MSLSMPGVLAAAPARANDWTGVVDGLVYSVDTGAPAEGATVISGSSAGTDVTIPSAVTIDGTDYAVTAIGRGAFTATGLESVTLPDTLETIGDAAFVTNELTTVTLPRRLIHLGEYAFKNNKLTSLTLPDSLTAVSRDAFANNLLEDVTLPNALESVGDGAFIDNQLTSVTLPDTVTSVGEWAFPNNSLTSVRLPDGVRSIGRSAFVSNRLTSVALPDALTTVSRYAFANNQLTSVALPEGLTAIDQAAFSDNRLETVEIPARVAEVGPLAFWNNPGLTSVRFTGPAPSISGAEDEGPSLAEAPGLTVEFAARYQQDVGGYTTPEWHGYPTVPAYTVFFDTGDGPAVDPVTIWAGEGFEPSAPARPGYSFAGWYTAPDLATRFDPDAALSLDEDITVYAGWERSSGPDSGGSSGLGSFEGLGSSDGLGSLGGLGASGADVRRHPGHRAAHGGALRQLTWPGHSRSVRAVHFSSGAPLVADDEEPRASPSPAAAPAAPAALSALSAQRI